MRDPMALVEFCMVGLVSRVAGDPLIKTLLAPSVWRDGPMTVPDVTPKLTPGLSPFVMAMMVVMLCAGLPTKRILAVLALMPLVPCAVLG
ncbi:protein of unknown function [Xenorhabdus doucetiae]|uniref:Uncharacterized protein n=1 Tax=Xenorhabdus doucetiae TaxID=351671 RepID=A0A068QRC6_9GAMM|nr:protein of unknown function [Xenorhabdus doucetiae]